MHVVEDRNGADTKVRDLVDDYHTVDVHSFHEPFVIASQGMVIGKLVDQFDHLDIVLGSVGGGGLRSGLCPHSAGTPTPRMAIFACEPAGALDAMNSVKQNRIVSRRNPNTLADGLRTSLGEQTLPMLRRHGTGLFAVGEEEIVQAMQFAYERLTLAIEPSSTVALVPLLKPAPQLVGKRVDVVLTGGNVAWLRPWPRLDSTEPMQQEGG